MGLRKQKKTYHPVIQSCTGTATQPPCQHPDDQWFRSVCTHCHLLLALAFFGLSMHVNSSTFVARASSVVCNLKARCKGTATHCKKTERQGKTKKNIQSFQAKPSQVKVLHHRPTPSEIRGTLLLSVLFTIGILPSQTVDMLNI